MQKAIQKSLNNIEKEAHGSAQIIMIRLHNLSKGDHMQDFHDGLKEAEVMEGVEPYSDAIIDTAKTITGIMKQIGALGLGSDDIVEYHKQQNRFNHLMNHFTGVHTSYLQYNVHNANFYEKLSYARAKKVLSDIKDTVNDFVE